MPKVKISEYSATANSNTDVASINIDEGCAPSGINNAIRAVMGHLKDFQQGTNGDPFNGPVNGTLGATTASTANVTTLTTSSTVTHNGGTANGVAYLNGSKVLTTGSALVFDGTNLGLGVTPSAWQSGIKVLQIGSYSSLGFDSANSTFLGNNWTYSSAAYKYINNGPATYYTQTGTGQHQWYNAASGTAGNAITFTQAMTLSAAGYLGISETSPSNPLSVRSDGTATGNGWNEISSFRNAAQSKGLNIGYNPSANNATLVSQSGGSASGFEFWGYTGSAWAERARIDSSGNLLVGTTTGSNHYIAKAVAEGADILGILSSTTNLQSAYFMGVSSAGENAAAAAIGVRKNVTTSRSINAGGTINASGADYAEYMTKAGNFTVAKGDVVGIDANGKLTNVFADSVSFMVKSTDPSYVGGDTWGSVDVLGQRPNDDATQEVKDAFYSALEAARQLVDRIAFAGQVPVNVIGATAGQYIIPVNNNGAIKGEAVSNPTFEQYQISVGKVIAIESDGRAKIIVKVA